jgi:hypothetical protein
VSSAAPIHVQVRFKAGAQDLSDIELSSFSNDGISASIEDPSATVARLPANGEHAWMLQLRPGRGDALPPGTYSVFVRVAFKEGKSGELEHYLSQPIKIVAPTQGAAPTLDLYPASIEGRAVSNADPIRVQVHLKAGSQDLTDVVISTFSNDGITAAIEGNAPADAARIPASGEQAWTLRLAPSGSDALGLAPRAANVAVAFTEGADTPRRRYLFQNVKITPPAAAAVPALADINIEGSLEPLSHERPGRLFVIVSNKYSQPLRLIDAQITGPKFVDFIGPRASQFKDPAVSSVPYGHAKVLTYDVAATDQIIPGKYPLIAEISVEAPDGISGSIDKSTEIELAVLGESDILGKLGAPSLLFLPGVLFLLAWQLLWSLGKSVDQRQTYSMTITSGSFWVIAIVISLFLAFAYPLIIHLVLGQVRDYLVGYGLKDFLYIFSLVMVSACVIFLLWSVLQRLAARYRAWLVLQTTPSENDRPIVILEKLGRLRQSIVFNKAHSAAGNAAQQVFVLEPWRGSESLWVAPPAQLQATDQATVEELNFVQQIANGRIVDARRMAKRLKKGMRRNWRIWGAGRNSWTLEWRQVGNVACPHKGAVASWTEDEAQGLLIDVA